MFIIRNIFAPGFPSSNPIACGSNGPVGVIGETVGAGATGLSYDPATDSYNYVWKSAKSWAGTCRQLIIRFVDGTVHSANLIFK
ncbi:MAG: PxKF domain-containing protein [Gammaproteobacteria bacterium]